MTSKYKTAFGQIQPYKVAFALVLAITLVACAGTGKPKADDISQRVQERWDLLLAQDYAAAYNYLSPGYRSSVSSVTYQRQRLLQRVRWNSAKYIDSTCLESSCKVQISLDFTLVGALPGVRRYDGTQEIEENWIRTEGQWWYVPEN